MIPEIGNFANLTPEQILVSIAQLGLSLQAMQTRVGLADIPLLGADPNAGPDDKTVVLAHPVLGDVTIPRDRVEEVRFAFHGRRVPVESAPHHLGTRPAFGFAVVKPEGLRFAKTVTVDPVAADGLLVIEAAQVSGPGPAVEVFLNGERRGALNPLADRPDHVVRAYRLVVPPNVWRKDNEVEVRVRPPADGKRAPGVDLRAVRLELPAK